MKNTIYVLISFIMLIILASCDPKSCVEYVIDNKLTTNIDIILYQGAVAYKSVYIPVNSKKELIASCGMGGGGRLTLEDTDSIHIILEDGIILKYTNAQPNNNIYDTENRDIWVEEYGKETRWQGSEYRFVFTIDESTVGD